MKKRTRFLATGMVVVSFLLLAAAGLYAQDYGLSVPTAINLSCDGKGSAPDNVSTYTPMFRWEFEDADGTAGDMQTAYRIRVGTSPGLGDMWDVTQTSSTITRMYGGAPLEANKTYYWSVQVWDRAVPEQPSSFANAEFKVMDIGLHAYDGSSVIFIAADDDYEGYALRIRKGTVTYGIVLVDPTEHGASKLRMRIASETKALKQMVPPPPAIGLSMGYMVFSGRAGGTDPAAQTVPVTNVGGGTLSPLSATVSGSGLGWLTASLGGDTTAPATLTVTPNTGSLAAGIHTATVEVASGAAANGPQKVSVTLKLSSSVSYNGNGAAGGSVPVDGNNYLPGETVTVLDNSGGLVRTGYAFSGWNTQADGGGATYTQYQTFPMGGSNVTLYARWLPTYATTYDANGAMVGSVPVDGNAYLNGTTVTVLDNSGGLARTGYAFSGWNTQADGGGFNYAQGQTFPMGGANQTLYAQWTANTYTVSFNAQGGSAPSPASKTVTYDSTYGTLATTSRAGYTLSGWWTGTGGTGNEVTSTTTVTITANQTLYAKWTANKYTVTFSAPDGSAPSPASKIVTYDSTYGTLATTSRTGYTLSGWWTETGGTGTEVLSTTAVAITVSQTLYAKWTANIYTVSFNEQGGSASSPASITVTYGLTYGTLATTSRTGYTFGGWYKGANGTGGQITSSTTVSITANQTLYANWVITWTATTMPASAYWYSVAYGNGVFVATAGTPGWGRGTLAATSPDGVTWTQRTMPSSELWTTVTFGGGKFVAIGYNSNKGATSTDGITWTSCTLPSTSNWMSVTYGNSTFVAIAEFGTTAASSPDGINWTARTLPASDRWSEVAYGNGVFVAVGGNNTTSSNAATSTDGAAWTLRSLPSSAQWSSLAFGNGTFVATAMNSWGAATSPDGVTWTARSVPQFYTLPIGYGAYFVAVSYGEWGVMTSPDGITWKGGSMPGALWWCDVAYGNGIYVVVARGTATAAKGP